MRLAAWVIVVGEFVVVLWLGWLYSRHGIVISIEKGADVATLVLTAAILIVTAVAVAVGVITIWGYNEIRTRAIDMAVSAATMAAAEEIRRAFGRGEQSPGAVEADQIAQAEDEPDAR
ncbi:MAG TPA: hypothetical protein VMF86_14900 [Stellaceae bacterium]|nr:hypothetical protein [Stellaceae bacterium]